MPIARQNNVTTIIITYPPKLENLFIICPQLDYSIGLHVYALLGFDDTFPFIMTLVDIG